jgi:hypothetical protein
MMTVTQTTRLIPWVIVGLIVLGALMLLVWPGGAEDRRANRHWFIDYRANLVSKSGSADAANEIQSPLPFALLVRRSNVELVSHRASISDVRFWGVKRTSRRIIAVSAFDPKRTFVVMQRPS